MQYSEIVPEAYASLVLEIDGGEPERTTTTVSGSARYPINGRFTYSYLTGFTQASDILTYALATPVPRKFLVSASITVKADSPGTRIHFGLNKNGVEVSPESISGTYLKTADEAQATSGMSFLVPISNDDYFEPTLWSDTDGLAVTLTHYNMVITPIGRQLFD